jgi:hypothetical protein
MFDYSIGARGMEPKLKFKFKEMNKFVPPLSDMIHKIILGPSVSSALTYQTFLRALERCGKSELKDKVVASNIPFRATY